MGYKLNLTDRVVLPTILKLEANYTTLIINKDIKKKVQITQDELVKYKFKNLSDGNVAWEETGEIFDIEFTDLEINEIKNNLNKLEQDNKLTESHIGLYELFIK